MLAFSPTHVYYSQEARSYSLGILFVLLSTYFFVRAVEENRASDWVLWTVCGIAAFYSHDFAALVLVAQAASLFFKAPPVPWRRAILCGCVIFVAALPGLTYVFRATPENLHFIWMPRPSPKEFWHLAMFFGGSGIKIALAWILWGAGIAAVIRARRDGADGIGLARVLAAVVGGAARRSSRAGLAARAHVPAALHDLLASGNGAAGGRGRRHAQQVAHRPGAGHRVVRGLHSDHRAEVQQAARRLARRNRTGLSSAAPGDAVAFFPFYTRIMLDYYSQPAPSWRACAACLAPAFYGGGEDARKPAAGAECRIRTSFQHVWILMADHGTKLEIFDHGAEIQAKLQEIYGDPVVHKFADIDVLEFGK